MKPRNRKLAIGIVLAALVAAWGLHCIGGLGGSYGAGDVLYTVRARREPFRVVVQETGVLRPKDVEVVPGPLNGQISWLIDEGTYVKKDDRLAVVDDTESRDKAEAAGFDLKIAKAQFEREKTALELLSKTLEIDRRTARIGVERSQFDLDLLRGQPDPSDLALAELRLRRATLTEDIARRDHEAQEKLWKEGVVSSSDLARARVAWRGAAAATENAQVDLDLTKKGASKEDVHVAEEKLRQARISLEQIDETTSAQLALKHATVSVAEAAVDQLTETLSRHETVLRNAVVKAPCEGTALYNLQWGRPEEGKRVWKGDPFIDIANLSKMVVDTQVNEVDVRSIGIGQPVRVRLEAFPQKEFHGRVLRMAGLAIDRSEYRQGIANREMSGVMVFEVVVEIDEEDPALRPTMSANLEIVVDEVANALSVPLRAVVERDGQKIVYVKSGARLAARKVKTGKANASRIVIEEGIEEGDEVCVLVRNV